MRAPPSPSSLDAWIAEALRTERLDAQSLIVTVFGDAIAPFGGQTWLKSLITLVEPFGLNERLVRTSVFRLAADGWLQARREGRRSEYRLTAQGLHRFELAHRRIYAEPHPRWSGQWTLVVLPGPEGGAAEAGTPRAQLRRELAWDGFVALAPGVLAHPSAAPQAVGALLDRLGLREQVFVLAAGETGLAPGRTLKDFARDAWALEAQAEAYRRFIDLVAPLRDALHARASTAASPREAFVARTLLIHQFRRVQLHDPQLPPDLLPPHWPGGHAYALCADAYRRLVAPANRHVHDMLKAESGFVPPLSPYFFQRFGGGIDEASV